MNERDHSTSGVSEIQPSFDRTLPPPNGGLGLRLPVEHSGSRTLHSMRSTKASLTLRRAFSVLAILLLPLVPTAAEAKPVPDLALKDLEGRARHLKDLR